MTNFRTSGFSGTPPVVKNLIIINVLMLLANLAFNDQLNFELGLYYFNSEHFEPYQLVSHMFMHGGFAHLFFNMFALWMFGRVLESVWGMKRFFIYYFVTGLGAAFLHLMVNHIQAQAIIPKLSESNVNEVMTQGRDLLLQQRNWAHPLMGKLNAIMNTPTVGASGAVFGILIGFGMLFPNTRLILLFPPIPIKAKYFVIILGGIELFLSVTQPGSGIAHIAHIGGMLFGFIMIKIWNLNKKSFY
jgi:membrane associated rhomboid family serine protease